MAPITPDSGILTFILNAFLGVFAGGFQGVEPDARRMLFLVSGIELTVAALWWALWGENFMAGLIQKIFLIGIFAMFVLSWPGLIGAAVNGFIHTGIAAGTAGGGGPFPALTNPSAIIDLAFDVTDPIRQRLDAIPWFSLGQIALYGLAMIGILIAFFFLAIQVVLTYLEFYIVAVLALILVPFGVNRHTAFLAEKAFGAIISFGVKLMVLAFIMSAATPVMTAITLPVDPTLKQAYCTLLAALLLAILAWKAPDVAAGLMSGGPTLHSSNVLRTVVYGSTLVGAGSRATERLVRETYSRGVSATLAAARLAGAAVAVAEAEGAPGIARAAAAGAVAPVRAAVAPVRAAWEAGRVRAARPPSNSGA
jgi:type IV secretion system protein TrbL